MDALDAYWPGNRSSTRSHLFYFLGLESGVFGSEMRRRTLNLTIAESAVFELGEDELQAM